MAGTIILTGANGSIGLAAADYLLKSYPEYTAIFTVRNATDTDANTHKLRDIISRYPQAKASIRQLDLADLSAVHGFASAIAASVASQELPRLKSILCCAYYWNLVGDSELTVDGYDKTIQVSHIAQAALVLRLVGSFAEDGRIVLFSSIGHYNKPNLMTHLLPKIPDGSDEILHPASGKDKQAHGFQRYATSKLFITTWMYPLNRYLQQDPKLKNVTAVAVNPGNIGDSRCFTTNTPLSLRLKQTFIMKPMMRVINRLADPTFRSSAEAASEVIDLAVGKAHPGERGYFTMLNKDDSDPITMDQGIQDIVWKKSLEWAKITKDNTALTEAIQ